MEAFFRQQGKKFSIILVSVTPNDIFKNFERIAWFEKDSNWTVVGIFTRTFAGFSGKKGTYSFVFVVD